MYKGQKNMLWWTIVSTLCLRLFLFLYSAFPLRSTLILGIFFVVVYLGTIFVDIKEAERDVPLKQLLVIVLLQICAFLDVLDLISPRPSLVALVPCGVWLFTLYHKERRLRQAIT